MEYGNKITFKEMVTLLKEDFKHHNSDIFSPGFNALMMHRFGNWRLSIPKPYRYPLSAVYRLWHIHVRNTYGIELTYETKIGRRLRFWHQDGVIIHGQVEIGDDVHLRQNVTLGNRRPDKPFDAPKIGNGCSIGVGACVLGNVTLGNNVTVGANSVVLEDVPDNTTVVGAPARPLPRKKIKAANG